jgi:hypothetical protein
MRNLRLEGSFALPKGIASELRWHLGRFAQPGSNGLVFIGPEDGRLRASTFRPTWTKAREAVGLPDVHFTICVTPTTRWRRARARACGS